MNKVAKILVSIGAIFIFLIMIGGLSRGTSSGSPGVLGIVLTFGLIAGLGAIWKGDNNDNDDDTHQLDKTN